MRSRATYSPNVAYRYQYIFDGLIKNKKSIVLDPKEIGYKLNTLKMYLSDSIKWLVDNEPNEEKRKNYALLKSQISIGFTLEEDKILIRFRNGSRAQKMEVTQVDPSADWKTPLLKWLASDTNAPLYIGGLALNEKEIAEANLMLPKHIESNITSQSIRAVK